MSTPCWNWSNAHTSLKAAESSAKATVKTSSPTNISKPRISDRWRGQPDKELGRRHGACNLVWQSLRMQVPSAKGSNRSTATLRSTATSFLPRLAEEDEGGGLIDLNDLNFLNVIMLNFKRPRLLVSVNRA